MLIVTPMLLLSTILFAMSAIRFYRYEGGTPTTAVVRCDGGPRNHACYGTWNIDGRPQTGPIRGPSSPDGSSIEVRVNGGIAFAGSPVLALSASLAVTVILAIPLMLFAIVRIRRWVRANR
jgi:hypothetical protein